MRTFPTCGHVSSYRNANVTTALVLFRNDLRLADNAALLAACHAHDQVLPVYVHSSDGTDHSAGGASRWWLHHSLVALQARLAHQGGQLHLLLGDQPSAVLDLARRAGAGEVYWNRRYEPESIAADAKLKTALKCEGLEAHSFPGNLWREPWQITTDQDQPYRVFTPFWRKLRSQLEPSEPLPEARARRWLKLSGDASVNDLDLLPKIPWDAGFAETWHPGEVGAIEQLEVFADDALGAYARLRDRPDLHGTSRLSPHLHFGEITPGQIQHALWTRASASSAKRRPDPEPYLRQLAWREFAHHLLYHYPTTPVENFNPRFNGFRWAPKDCDAIRRWQRGETGIPLVDAGMRELWHTGWMHNRVRMVVASFLTKNLRQHWLHGARWFWDTLVDADLANNTLGWQWVAGCGADAAPYFRVFNPYTQAKKFDPEASYLKRWLPQLARLPAPLLHEPWRDRDALTACGYPLPMVDLGASRHAALEAYAAIKGE